MKNRSFLLKLIQRLVRVYCSATLDKEQQYKKIIFYTLKDLGGIYIKFLQVLCMNQNFMDQWGTPKEMEIFNKVIEEPILLDAYIDKNGFSYVEKTPFATGSFAQVYKAKLKSGDKVVLKILRPSIIKNLQKDLKKLKRMVKLISFFLPKTLVDYNSAFLKFSNNCLQEIDYEQEIANMKYFANLYQNHSFVVIPKVYENLCTKEMIVQEYLEGPTLIDVMNSVPHHQSLETYALEKTGSDINFQIVIAGGEALRTAMVADYVFGDPHPGNIILLANNKIAFIDFGIVAQKPTSQEAFYLWVKSYYDILIGNINYGNLLRTSCMCFCPDFLNALDKCSIDTDIFSSIENAINKKVNKVSKDNFLAKQIAEDGHLFTAFTKFIDGKNALNLNIDLHNFQLLKAMQMFLSTVNTLSSKYQIQKFNQIMAGAMHYALTYCERVGVKKDMHFNTKYSVNESYELLLETLSSLAQSDEFLFENICERMFL